MTEVLENIHRLKALPQDLHWFCPRSGDEGELYYDEDVYNDLRTESEAAKSQRLEKLQQVESRKVVVLDALRIFAFDGPDAAPYQSWIQQRLESQLMNCDVCIRVYHKARAELRHRLEQEFQEEEVASFITKFDGINIDRITNGLTFARAQLLSLPPDQRRIAAIDAKAIYALFEALSCKPFIRDDELLSKYFDEPFALVQTKKRLILNSYLPAMTHFHFSSHESRYQWAANMWRRVKRPPTSSEFDWAIKEPLVSAMGRIQIFNMEPGFSPRFWSGAHMIISKLTKDLVTHGVRGMEIDIYKLALDHLQLDLEAFLDIVRTLKALLDISPTDFWASMGSISPTAIAEQIFNSPAMERMLLTAESDGASDLSEAMTWIDPFMASIKSSNQPPVCRAIVHQLLDRCQEDKYSPTVRSFCLTTGFRVLVQTLHTLNEGRKMTTFVGDASIADILALVAQYIDPILKNARGLRNTKVAGENAAIPVQIIEKALALDCLTLVIGKEKVKMKQPLGQDQWTKSVGMWEKIIKSIKTGDQALATHALLGSLDLVGLESFVAGKGSVLLKDERQFNKAFDMYCQYVAEMLWRVNTEFSSYDIAGMFMIHSHARSIVSALLSSNNDTCQAAVEVLKTISVEDGRREALHYVLEKAYESVLLALSDVIRRIASKKPFAPMPAVLKLSMDVVDSLCDSEDGILRSKMLSDNESNATQSYWESVWDALNVIFKSTETWSYKGYDKTEMQDFCRDTMEFADKFFNNYDVYVNALAVIDHVTGVADSSKVANQLLQHPKDTMDSMVVWLRLRDEYLASKIVDLVSKLLVKLRNVDLKIKESTREYIEDVITSKIKAKLSPQQIAELRRALETHTGQRLAFPDHPHQSVKVDKQGSLNSWITSDSKKGMVLVGPRKTQSLQHKVHESDSSDSMKDVIKQSTKAAQAYKERMAARAQQAPIVKVKEPPKALLDADSIKKRKAEAEARKRADLNRARALRGLPPLPNPSVTSDTNAAKDKANIPKGTGVMVSSDEDSDDSCDPLDRELFGITKPTKADAAKAKSKGPIEFIDEAPARKGPVKIQRIVRSARDMRARLAPDLAALHKEILHWDYFGEGEFPPGSSPDQYKAVPNKFRNTLEYKNTFRPLLTLEAWQGFVKAREEITSKPYLTKVLNRTSVDAFTEIGTTMTHAESAEQPLSEGDIILFSKSSNPVQDSSSPHCLARVWRITRKRHHLDVVYRAMPLNPLMKVAGPDSSMYGVKVYSITPLEREYGALQGLEYYDLCDYILNAQPSNLLSYGNGQIDPIKSTYELNTAQAMAVRSALDNDAFTLIQGPPGSGKTKTIVAIVGAIISPAFRYEGEQIGDPKGQANYRRSKKMLVCAPSNAAVDELVMRFKKGITTMRGSHYDINVVRVGRSDNINSQVRDVTLEELVNARLNGLASGNGSESKKVREVMKSHQDISQKLREARERLNSGKAKDSQEDQDWRDAVKELQKRKAELSADVDKARDSERRMARDLDLERKRVQQAVLDQAHVVCATLSGSGHEMFQNLNIEFETVIVDEAAQCVEMSALIPLKYGCSKCILVGDPKQLPPTVFSREAARFQYEQSLFVRMQTNHPDSVHLLDTQYRMHPEISIFPSNTFYDGRLRDGPDMKSLRQQPWHANELLGPFRFFDVSGQHQSDVKGHSLINRAEIDMATALVRRVLNDFDNVNFKRKIGIITPYKSQLRELKRSFINKYGESITDFIEFNTTDAFQGRESEIIIFSCVRAQTSGSVGFLADIRRMNVGLTRAKSSLWVLGNSETLMRGEFWRKLIEDAKKRDRFWNASRYMGPLMESSNAKEPKLKPMKPKPVPVPEADMLEAPVANMARMASMSPASDGFNSNDSGRVSLPASLSNSRAPSVSMSDSLSLPPRANTNSPANVAEMKSHNPSRQSSAEVKDVEMKDVSSDDKNTPKIRVVQPPKNFNPLGGNSLSKPTQNPVVRKRPLDNNPLLIRKKQKKP